MSRPADLIRFYTILDRLEARIGTARTLAAATGRMTWPRRGVYFFREQGESRTDSGTGPRVVRVGTHGLKAGGDTKLWGRLSAHRGQPSTGGGNHRGSIFRLLVGEALIARTGYDYPTWGKGSSAPKSVTMGEVALEQEVSCVIGSMPCLWLALDDDPGPDSLRGYVERNAIALLSNYQKPPLDPPSAGWLGCQSGKEKVRASGLWNSRHVEEEYAPDFLSRFETMVEEIAP